MNLAASTSMGPPSKVGAKPEAEVEVELVPLGRKMRVARGASLRDALFRQGVEFPCGGRGRCRGCRVRVLEGLAPPDAGETEVLSAREREEGWRLGCRIRANADLRLELARWEASILTDEASVEFVPREGAGVVVDLGTTTLVAQWLDLRTGRVLGVRTALNGQARFGADLMSRVEFSLRPEGAATLTRLIREQIGGLISELAAEVGAGWAADLAEVIVVGNTVMHHLFGGRNVEPLARYPFEPEWDGPMSFRPAELGWTLPEPVVVRFLPCLGGFVGSDVLAGILATGMDRSEAPMALVDLGTNGEIVVGNRERMLCTSTAAGPAFEGARIRMGMRAATGAISEVQVVEGGLRCHVLGQGTARGVCGSGLVDAVAAGLELGRILASGRLTGGAGLQLAAPVVVGQSDIRELQLAKGAISAGLRLLLEQWGTGPDGLACLQLAGAFGNYINRTSARRIGLLDYPVDKVVPAGNTALRGAKVALLGARDGEWEDFAALRRRVRHVSLSADPRFEEVYVEEMPFPG